MPAAVAILDNPTHEETLRPLSPPAAEGGRPEPRFRVVTRKPTAPPRRRKSSQVRNAMMFAAAPAFCLLLYVGFWTMAVSGGYQRDQLRQQLASIKIEQAELEAEKRKAQSPAVIQNGAVALGMTPALEKMYAQAKTPAPAPVQQ